MGVLTHFILTRNLPFDADDEDQVPTVIWSHDVIDVFHTDYKELEDDSKYFIYDLLHGNQDLRLKSTEAVKGHEFFKMHNYATDEDCNQLKNKAKPVPQRIEEWIKTGSSGPIIKVNTDLMEAINANCDELRQHDFCKLF